MFYGKDLARIHDEGFKAFSDHAFRQIARTVNLSHPMTIIDLGCGSGELLKKFAGTNHTLIGVDVSAEMIRLAKASIPEAELITGSIYEVAFKSCHLITAVGEVLNYRISDASNLDRFPLFFQNLYAGLLPGGVFLFDVMLETETEDRTYQTFHDAKDWTVLMSSVEDRANKQVKREIITFKKKGNGYQKSKEYHCLELYSKKQLASLLTDVGFEVRFSDHYGGFL